MYKNVCFLFKVVFAASVAGLFSLVNSTLLAQEKATHNSPVNNTKSHTLRTGYFKNGLKYYIQHNSAPAQRAEIWLAVDAGAIHEDDDQLGFAHFLEHMAFNGTRKFPGNTLIDVIEQSGMTFGADLNAYTSFDETVYQLMMPTDNPRYIENGLSIIHEWASGAMLIDSMDVVLERGVVVGEWRQRFIDSLQYRQFKEQITRTMGGANKYMERLPIGSHDLINNANPGPLKRFYKDWYRPDLMAVIVIGDFETDKMYELVKEKFGNIPAAKVKRPFKRPQVNYDSVASVSVVKDRVNPLVSVSWRISEGNLSKEATVKKQAVQSLLWGHINDAFGRYAKMERRPFAGAGIRLASPMARPMGNRIELNIAMAPDSIEHALSYALREIERVAQEGLNEADLEKAKALLLRSWQRGADRVDVVTSRSLATRYVDDFLIGDNPLITPIEQLEIGESILQELSNKDIREAAAFWRSSEGRYVTIQIPLFASVRVPTEAEVLKMMDPSAVLSYTDRNSLVLPSGRAASEHKTIGGRDAVTASEKSINAESAVVSEEYDRKSGVKTWNMVNGTRVVFKETNNNPDEIIIHAISPGGFSKLPDSLRMSSGRLIADLMTASGSPGVKDRTQFIDNLRRSGLTNFGVILSGFTEEVVIAGSSRTPEALFETMHRQFTDPHIDSLALAEWKRTGMRSITYSQADNFAYSLTSDRRLAPPSTINVQFMNLNKGMAVYKDRFGDASDFTFYIVGAISEETARRLASQYIAVLPSTNRSTTESLITTTVNEFRGKRTSTVKNPRLQAVQAVADISFKGYLPASNNSDILDEQKYLNTVSWILSRRLRNKLREEMSVTYGANAQSFALPIPDWYYNLGIQFMTSPEDIHRSVDSVWSVIADLKANGPTTEELEMSARIQRRRWENAQQSNAWLVSQLSSFDRLGVPFSRLAARDDKPLSIGVYKEKINKYLPDNYLQTIALPTEETIRKAKEER